MFTDEGNAHYWPDTWPDPSFSDELWAAPQDQVWVPIVLIRAFGHAHGLHIKPAHVPDSCWDRINRRKLTQKEGEHANSTPISPQRNGIN